MQSKNRIMINVGISVKNYMRGSCEKSYMWLPITFACECNNACKIDEYLDTKNCLCKKRLNSKLVLECEDKTFNTTETS